MLVSVIIPVYNSQSTITRCIESVKKSIEKITLDYEIICVDDGSSDNSLDIINTLANQYPQLVVVHQNNSGAANARNKGLEISKGEYIAFNDSDDEWLENHFEFLLDLFKKYPEIDCVSGNHDVEKQKTQFLKKIENNLYKTNLKSQLLKNYFSPPNTMLKRAVLETGIKFCSGMRYAEEGFFFNWISKDFYACFINQKLSQSILGKARFGESGLSGNLKAMEQGELYNIHYAYKNFGVPLYFYIFAKFFSIAKYFRRILIVKIRNSKRNKND